VSAAAVSVLPAQLLPRRLKAGRYDAQSPQAANIAFQPSRPSSALCSDMQESSGVSRLHCYGLSTPPIIRRKAAAESTPITFPFPILQPL
jgi:hypothetical protein